MSGAATRRRATRSCATASSCTYSPLVKYVAGRSAGPAQPRRGGRPRLLRPARPDQRDRALRPRPRDQVRDVRDQPHQGRDHRRAALAGLGAALRAQPRARDRARDRSSSRTELQRAPTDEEIASRSGSRQEEFHANRRDPPLVGRRARRAVDDLVGGRRHRRADRHDRGSARRGPAGSSAHRAAGGARRGDPSPARARAPGDRALLLRGADAAGDRRDPRRHRSRASRSCTPRRCCASRCDSTLSSTASRSAAAA